MAVPDTGREKKARIHGPAAKKRVGVGRLLEVVIAFADVSNRGPRFRPFRP